VDINCEDCNNKGWVKAYSYDSINVPDGNYIQHCGNCKRLTSDREAVAAYCDLLSGYTLAELQEAW